ncbi:MAG: hypothetical protein ACT4NY_12350 [Pseudonocardiales bacterium]
MAGGPANEGRWRASWWFVGVSYGVGQVSLVVWLMTLDDGHLMLATKIASIVSAHTGAYTLVLAALTLFRRR